MTNYKLLTTALFTAILSAGIYAFGEETKTEKLQTMGNKTVDATKRTYRNAKDELCEMIDGKAHCVVKKVVNKVKNTADKINTKASEAKNKAD